MAISLGMGAAIAGIAGGAASLFGSAKSGSDAAGMSKYQLDYQRDLANSAHVRQVADLKLAGLNPILSARYGGAGNVSPVGTNIPDYGKSASVGIQAAATAARAHQAEAAVEQMGASTSLLEQQKRTEIERGLEIQAKTRDLNASADQRRADIGLTEHKQEFTRATTILTELGVPEKEATAFVYENLGEILKIIQHVGGPVGGTAAQVFKLWKQYKGKK